MPVGEPPAELDIDPPLVRGLLERQFPELAKRPLRLVANGWDNCTFRLGDELAVRVPRREVADRLIRNEQRFLPGIAERVSVAIPSPLYLGAPDDSYPWAFSIVPWFEGSPAAERPLEPSQALELGRFLAELHIPAEGGAPLNPYRGVPLAERASSFEERLASVRARVADLDFVQIERTWTQALEAAPGGDEAGVAGVWLHGDLHPKNVLTGSDGEMVAVIDWGDITSGDAATDLASLWMHFPVSAHEACLEAYGRADGSTHQRACGWALLFGLILYDTGLAGDQAFLGIGRTILERVLES